jgi:hypothetical protein
LNPGAVLEPLGFRHFCVPGQSSPAESSQLAVFVIDGRALTTTGETGDIIRTIIVTDDSKAGEVVVTRSASFLYDGQPVEVSKRSDCGLTSRPARLPKK